jgi:ectoine hydroxylase-related dioxygenase (phytanoyl-CoA dioxygenase family)
MRYHSAMIDPGLRRTYERDGVVHLPAAFDARWVARLREGIERVIERSRDPAWPREREFRYSPQNPLSVSGGTGGVTVGGTMAMHVVPHDPVFEEWIRESPAAALVGDVVGARHLRYWQDAVFIKEGRGDDGTPWHNDYCTWPFAGERLPILWIALDDVGPEDAPLVTVRGSHTDPWRYYSPMSPPGLAVTDQYHAWDELLAKATNPDAVLDVWTVRAGDALVMHSKLIHCSRPRTSAKPGRRTSFSTRWLGDDAIWAPDPYTFRIEKLLAHPRMVPGRAPPDELFPIVWRRAA